MTGLLRESPDVRVRHLLESFASDRIGIDALERVTFLGIRLRTTCGLFLFGIDVPHVVELHHAGFDMDTVLDLLLSGYSAEEITSAISPHLGCGRNPPTFGEVAVAIELRRLQMDDRTVIQLVKSLDRDTFALSQDRCGHPRRPSTLSGLAIPLLAAFVVEAKHLLLSDLSDFTSRHRATEVRRQESFESFVGLRRLGLLRGEALDCLGAEVGWRTVDLALTARVPVSLLLEAVDRGLPSAYVPGVVRLLAEHGFSLDDIVRRPTHRREPLRLTSTEQAAARRLGRVRVEDSLRKGATMPDAEGMELLHTDWILAGYLNCTEAALSPEFVLESIRAGRDPHQLLSGLRQRADTKPSPEVELLVASLHQSMTTRPDVGCGWRQAIDAEERRQAWQTRLERNTSYSLGAPIDISQWIVLAGVGGVIGNELHRLVRRWYKSELGAASTAQLPAIDQTIEWGIWAIESHFDVTFRRRAACDFNIEEFPRHGRVSVRFEAGGSGSILGVMLDFTDPIPVPVRFWASSHALDELRLIRSQADRLHRHRLLRSAVVDVFFSSERHRTGSEEPATDFSDDHHPLTGGAPHGVELFQRGREQAPGSAPARLDGEADRNSFGIEARQDGVRCPGSGGGGPPCDVQAETNPAVLRLMRAALDAVVDHGTLEETGPEVPQLEDRHSG